MCVISLQQYSVHSPGHRPYGSSGRLCQALVQGDIEKRFVDKAVWEMLDRRSEVERQQGMREAMCSVPRTSGRALSAGSFLIFYADLSRGGCMCSAAQIFAGAFRARGSWRGWSP